ncbi:serine hydrolase [Ferruginibacter paludis]|uniref:serine hydrolase domain-containing protein n=1 Tax=Ferruginibacter paludis TaxID=1310417 RepID=UPI0025B46F37|nr:serine hydrolase [Ferruginibacter paludis]MDN3657365.1 serine hydrolase [Ferruginibacter paludis]
MKKKIKKIVQYFFLLLLFCFVVYVWKFLPIVNGHVAKEMCSDVFVSGRTPDDIAKHETGIFPYNLGSYKVDRKDSSVTVSVFGLAKRKAIYRSGLGATLISGISETELRQQPINITSALSFNQDTIIFPQGNRTNDGVNAGVNKVQLNAAIKAAFDEPDNKQERQTRAVLVVYDGQIVGEKYAQGYSVNSKQLSWSMTKGIVNAMTGILVQQGKLNINAAAPIDQWQKDERNKITIADLMHMSSGLRFWWFPFGPSDLTNMLFKERNMSEFAADKSLKDKPGEVFNYSDGSANILSYVIRKTVGDKDYYLFPYEYLFHKIGMNNTLMEVDASGTFVGSSYCYSTARDWARFGLLYLNDGVWNGERILPEGWVKFTATASSAKNERNGKYGALWWTNEADKNNVANKDYPNVPADCIYCQGFDGQYVWVIPSKKLVVVRFAFEHGNYLDPNFFLSEVIKALPETPFGASGLHK